MSGGASSLHIGTMPSLETVCEVRDSSFRESLINVSRTADTQLYASGSQIEDDAVGAL